MRCLLVLSAVVALIGCSPEPVRRDVPAPRTELDTRYLPVLNVDFTFTEVSDSPDLISRTADATKAVAEQLTASTAEARSVTAVNFTVKAGADPQQQIHFTIAGKPFTEAAAASQPAGFYLTLTTEAGASTPEAREAVREYCQNSASAFCTQID